MSAESWGHFYAGAGGVDYFLRHLSIHAEFLGEILSRRPRKILEAGCGSAIMSTFFSMAGLEVVACDRDEGVLAKAAQISREWNSRVRFVKQDLLTLSFAPNEFDASFSQGVLEHMGDADIRTVGVSLLKISPTFIFSVPSVYYKHRDFGDERLLTKEAWEKSLAPVGHFQARYYYEERVKRNFLIKRPLMILGVLTR